LIFPPQKFKKKSRPKVITHFFNHQLYFVLKPIIGVTFELTSAITEINSISLFLIKMNWKIS